MQATGAQPYSGKVGSEDVDKVDMAYRVVADHIRTLSFAIADGSRPGNEGREYVLRRILRRAVRYGREVLKAKEGFFNGLVNVVANVMGDVFPELKQHEVHIKDVIKEEEESFGRTLIKGIEKFEMAVRHVQGKILSGQAIVSWLQDAFILWDTYGFPLDLTQLMAEEKGLLVDVEGFNRAMEEARERSRNAQTKQAGGVIIMDADATSTLYKRGIAPTDDSFKFIWLKVTWQVYPHGIFWYDHRSVLTWPEVNFSARVLPSLLVPLVGPPSPEPLGLTVEIVVIDACRRPVFAFLFGFCTKGLLLASPWLSVSSSSLLWFTKCEYHFSVLGRWLWWAMGIRKISIEPKTFAEREPRASRSAVRNDVARLTWPALKQEVVGIGARKAEENLNKGGSGGKGFN
ncbi:alanine--tRNA ligase isoform X2 [Senna tora]|uniref:Alanine--tRNA ligase isoform X2 n=1 Tax=Senna tora TaxID=362788 RepID=A0A834SCT4_9FABA|nr:alanine--tRNA ligase isoform X2 [Senna tora]